jgi:hypothetical protein
MIPGKPASLPVRYKLRIGVLGPSHGFRYLSGVPGKPYIALEGAAVKCSNVNGVPNPASALTKSDPGGTCQRLPTSVGEGGSLDASQRDRKHLAAGVKRVNEMRAFGANDTARPVTGTLSPQRRGSEYSMRSRNPWW